MTLHDLSPWKNQPWRAASARVRRRTPWLLRLGLADMVITPTEAVRQEAIAHFGLAEDQVVPIPEAATALFRPVETAPETSYVLAVGTIEPRKNLAVAAEACRLCGIELRLAGRGEWPETPGVRVLGAVADHALPWLYSGASALVIPSLYEGFGLPVVEAMQCGTPVITSLDPALMEVSGGAALHVDANDARGWAEAIRCVVRNRKEWTCRSLARASQFSWQRTAQLTWQVYQEAMWRHKPS
jgi:glycosyltransferase involved in cell wall biosynthesis